MGIAAYFYSQKQYKVHIKERLQPEHLPHHPYANGIDDGTADHSREEHGIGATEEVDQLWGGRELGQVQFLYLGHLQGCVYKARG